MADKQKMSVEEILAACRKEGSSSGGKSPATGPIAAGVPPAESSSSLGDAAAEIPKPKKATVEVAPSTGAAAAGKTGAAGKSAVPASVADILAAARAGKLAGAKPNTAAAASEATSPKKNPPKAPVTPKPVKPEAAEKGATKPVAPKAAAAEKPAAQKDTASILSAAHAAAKPGPISKAELAARSKELPAAVGKKKGVVPPIPEKPGYAMARPMAASRSTPGRRGFLQAAVAGTFAAFAGSSLAVGFSSLAVTFNLWLLGTARFMFPNILIEPPTKFKVGFPNDLGAGQVQTKYVPQFGVWIVRYEYDGSPQIYALQTVCTHLGCTPNWLEGEQKFKCPCHGSGFYKDGINFEGPAPRPLERFSIRLADDGQLEVDKSRKFKEELGQWRDPASFVPV